MAKMIVETDWSQRLSPSLADIERLADILVKSERPAILLGSQVWTTRGNEEAIALVRALDIPKTQPEDVAGAILDAVQAGEEDIFPDPMSAALAESWRSGVVKQLERQNAALVPAEPIAA